MIYYFYLKANSLATNIVDFAINMRLPYIYICKK